MDTFGLFIFEDQKKMEEEESKALKDHYKQLKLLMGQKGYASKRREQNKTNEEMLNSTNTTRYIYDY